MSYTNIYIQFIHFFKMFVFWDPKQWFHIHHLVLRITLMTPNYFMKTIPNLKYSASPGLFSVIKYQLIFAIVVCFMFYFITLFIGFIYIEILKLSITHFACYSGTHCTQHSMTWPGRSCQDTLLSNLLHNFSQRAGIVWLIMSKRILKI